jgi:hypothetical protein
VKKSAPFSENVLFRCPASKKHKQKATIFTDFYVAYTPINCFENFSWSRKVLYLQTAAASSLLVFATILWSADFCVLVQNPILLGMITVSCRSSVARLIFRGLSRGLPPFFFFGS